MLHNYTKICKPTQIKNILKLYLSTETKEKWNIFTSVCLERKPIITPELNELESTFQKYLLQVELERSLKCDHEIRHENDKKQALLLKHAENDNVDLDAAALQTAQDFEDACIDELSKFKFADRKTDADRQNKMQSLERKLDKYLVLVTKQSIGNKHFFLPPQGLRKSGETLRQTAQRILTDLSGNDLKTQIYGNAPVGFYKYKYPKHLQKGFVGAKVFIYFGRYLKGQISPTNDYMWLDRSEMSKEIPHDYHKCLSKFLIDERSVETSE